MLKFYSIIIGEDPKYTAIFQPASKRKIVLYANCLMVPVILWFINGYMLVSKVLEGSILSAFLTAFIAALIIFLIERAIIMASGSKLMFVFRIVLGIIVALLGSVSLDEVIFKNDIDNRMAEYKQAKVDSAIRKIEREYQDQISSRQSKMDQHGVAWNQSLSDAKSEADGTGGSHTRQVGKITMLKMNVAAIQQEAYDKEKYGLDSLRAQVGTSKDAAKTRAEAEFEGNALLLRIRAMVDLVKEDKFMFIVYLLVTSFLFALEFLVLVVKLGSKRSIDEELEKAREDLLRTKTEKILNRSEIYFAPEELSSTVKSANAAMQKKPSSIFS